MREDRSIPKLDKEEYFPGGLTGAGDGPLDVLVRRCRLEPAAVEITFVSANVTCTAVDIPPDRLAEFGRFLTAFAGRFGGKK